MAKVARPPRSTRPAGKDRPKTPEVSFVGIRELRGSLSKLMRQVRGGLTLTVTDRGAPIALILPAGIPPGLVPMVADGRLKWRGRPGILPPPLPTPPGLVGRSLSDAVIEERDEDERSFDAVQ